MDDQLRPTRPGWSDLPPAALIFRVAHALWALVSLVALAEIWRFAITGRHARRLVASVGWLSLEGDRPHPGTRRLSIRAVADATR